MTYNGIANQLYSMVSALGEFGECIQTAFVCLNVNLKYKRCSLTFTEYVETCLSTRKNNSALYNSIFYIPGGLESIWEKIFLWHNDFKPDKIIIYTNIDIFESYTIPKLQAKMYLWIPIHEDFSENNSQVRADRTLQFLPIFDKIATFSKFGQNVLAKWGYQSVFINHIIDKKVFYKKYKKNDTRFTCLIVANNACPVFRKAIKENIMAFKKFSHNKNTILIIKSEPSGTTDIKKLLTGYDNFFIVNENIPEDTMIQLYCISDVLLAASRSEGFGVPIVEAQLCGTPVITTNCTSMPENTFFGICTEPTTGSIKINGINSWSNPDVDNIVNAIEIIYNGNLHQTDIPDIYNPIKIATEWKKFLEINY